MRGRMGQNDVGCRCRNLEYDSFIGSDRLGKMLYNEKDLVD